MIKPPYKEYAAHCMHKVHFILAQSFQFGNRYKNAGNAIFCLKAFIQVLSINSV